MLQGLPFTVDLTRPFGPTFVLPLPALAAAAICVSAMSVNAARRALCVALRWLARRFISFALFLPNIGSSKDWPKRSHVHPNVPALFESMDKTEQQPMGYVLRVPV